MTGGGGESSAGENTALCKPNKRRRNMGYILLWLIGIPIPIIILLALLH